MSSAPAAQKRVMNQRLEAMIALTETAECRTHALLACFGEELPAPCGHCDNCLSPPVIVDGLQLAQKVLSAVYRTGQRFGALHVIAVLRGELTDAVKRWGHEALPTFGTGKAHAPAFWRGVIRQLIASGVLAVDMGEFATLSLVTEKARPILRGEIAVKLRQDAPPVRARAEARVLRAPAPAADGDLFETLRAWRADEAKSQRVPPYVIFHDSVLRDIAAVRPRSADELGQIKGVGTSKLGRYGAAVLKTVATSA